MIAVEILLDAAPSVLARVQSAPTLFAVAFATRDGVQREERAALVEALAYVFDDPGSRGDLISEAFPVLPRTDGPETWGRLRPAIVDELNKARRQQPAADFVLSLAAQFPFAYEAIDDDVTGGGYVDLFAMTAVARALDGTRDVDLARPVLEASDRAYVTTANDERQVILEFLDTLDPAGAVYAQLPAGLARAADR